MFSKRSDMHEYGTETSTYRKSVRYAKPVILGETENGYSRYINGGEETINAYVSHKNAVDII